MDITYVTLARSVHLLVLALFLVPVLAFAAPADTTGEIPIIKDTSYPVPPDALVVSHTGSDSNSGNLAAPFRTITHAVQAAPAGATIVIREGTYRESVPHFFKRLTIQPYPYEKVWLKGSLVVSDWVPDGVRWRKDNWTFQFDSQTYDSGAVDPAFPLAGWPDMVFVDGQPMRQVGSLSEVDSNTFYVDYQSDKLYLGSDPSGKTVEAAAYRQGVRASAEGTTIRGLGFMHYAGDRFQGMLQFDQSDNVVVENNTFAWGASRGLATFVGDGAIVRGNTFLNNGQIGYSSWRYENVHIEANRFAGNNQEHFLLHGAAAEPAGAKLTVGRNWIIRDNAFENNQATGLWLDISNYNTTIVSNTVVDNLSYGIYYEISGKAIIASNLVAGNTSGIRVSNSSQVKIYNNTLVRNFENLSIQDDSRENTNSAEIALGISYVTEDVELKNNIFSNGNSSQNPFIWARDYNSTPLKSADQMISVADANAYNRTNGDTPSQLVEWWRGTQMLEFDDLDAFRTATGYEANGIEFYDMPSNPFFIDESRGNYRLKPDSIAVGAGVALPLDVAEAIGVSPGLSVDLGVLVLSWPTTPPNNEPPAAPNRLRVIPTGLSQ